VQSGLVVLSLSSRGLERESEDGEGGRERVERGGGRVRNFLDFVSFFSLSYYFVLLFFFPEIFSGV
jgi:hypothetical protein